MDSIISQEKRCLVCWTDQNLHRHHIFPGTANRRLSEQYGCWCWLCGDHHNLSDRGVHFNPELDLYIKRMAQAKFETIYGHEKFVEVFGKNYL